MEGAAAAGLLLLPLVEPAVPVLVRPDDDRSVSGRRDAQRGPTAHDYVGLKCYRLARDADGEVPWSLPCRLRPEEPAEPARSRLR